MAVAATRVNTQLTKFLNLNNQSNLGYFKKNFIDNLAKTPDIGLFRVSCTSGNTLALHDTDFIHT